MLTALLVANLTERTLPRISTDDLLERLADAGLEPGMRAADIWPSEPGAGAPSRRFNPG